MSLYYKIVNNYARVLYSQALKYNIIELVSEQLVLLKQIMMQSSIIMRALCLPIVDMKTKRKIIDLIKTRMGFNYIVVNFLYVVVKHCRTDLVFEIINDFLNMVLEGKNIKNIKLTLAHDVDQQAMNRIRTFLERELQKRVNLNVALDSSLVGGAVVEYDSVLMDCSISGALRRIERVVVSNKT